MKNFFSLIGLILVFTIVIATVLTAGCTSKSSEIITKKPDTADFTEIRSPENISVPVSSAITLVRMNSAIMEAVESALIYPVLKKSTYKSEFEVRIAEFDMLSSLFFDQSGLSQPENAELNEAFEGILLIKSEFVNRAGDIFKSYEESGVVNIDDMILFEASIDDLTISMNSFMKNHFRYVSEDDLDRYENSRPALTLLAMHRDIMEGIEEAFGYILLNDTVEKEEFFMKMEEFDNKGEIFLKIVSTDLSKEDSIQKDYNSMIQAKKEVQTAAEKMFADYEMNSAISGDAAKEMEASINNFTTAYDLLLKGILGESGEFSL